MKGVKMRPVTTGSNARRSYNKVIDGAGDNPFASMYSAAFGQTSGDESKKKADALKKREAEK